MSYAAIRKALESRLNSMTPKLTTAWENVKFTPTTNTEHQRANLLPVDTENPTLGPGGIARETGIFQVTLLYPQGGGVKKAIDRAELVRAHFPRGLTLTSGAVKVLIMRKPSVAPGLNDTGYYVLPISIPYYSEV